MNDPATYRAPRWLPGGHAQTVYAQLRRPAAPGYRRVRWETPDGDFIDLDRVDAAAPSAPLLVLFHGLEGSSRSSYAAALMGAAQRLGMHGVVPHFRGCSGEPNRLPRAYHSGDHAELDWILRRLRAEQPDRPIYATGVSLGGSALLNWLGRQGASAQRIVVRAAAVCAPIDLPAAGQALGRGVNRLYAAHFLSSLIPKALAKLERFPGLYDSGAVAACRTLEQFDNLVTAPLHGFRDTEDYWRRAASRPWLRNVGVPTLVMNARNDPFVPAASLPGRDEVSSLVRLDYPAAGGHVGFVAPPFPGRLDWLARRLLAFFTEG